jgi:hypothetical protein
MQVLAGGGASDLSFQRPTRGFLMSVVAPCASARLESARHRAASTHTAERCAPNALGRFQPSPSRSLTLMLRHMPLRTRLVTRLALALASASPHAVQQQILGFLTRTSTNPFSMKMRERAD